MNYETSTGFAESTPRYDIVRRVLATLFALVLGIAVALAIGITFVYGATRLARPFPSCSSHGRRACGIIVLLPFLVVRVIAGVFTALKF